MDRWKVRRIEGKKNRRREGRKNRGREGMDEGWIDGGKAG